MCRCGRELFKGIFGIWFAADCKSNHPNQKKGMWSGWRGCSLASFCWLLMISNCFHSVKNWVPRKPSCFTAATYWWVMCSINSVFQSGVSLWLTWGVHPDLHPGIKEIRPERHRLPLPDIWSAGIPTGAAHSLCFLITSFVSFPLTLSSSISHLLFITPFVYPFLPSLISLLPSHPLSPSIYFFPVTSFQFSRSLSFHASFVLSLFFIWSCSLSLPISLALIPRSSSALLFHSPSLLFMCVPWWSTGVPQSPHNH